MRSWKKPTPEQIETTLSLIQDPTMREYFFVRLENPLWIDELRRLGLFGQPPGVTGEPDDAGPRLSPWPELDYLIRMAREYPQGVAEVLLELPSSDSLLVKRGIIDALLNMEIDQAAKLTPRVVEILNDDGQHLFNWRNWLDHPLCTLIGRLASSGKPDEALALTHSVLQLSPSEREPVELDDGTIMNFYEAKTVFEEVYVDEVLSGVIPRLALQRPLPTLDMLLGVLDSAIRYTLAGRGRALHDDGFRWRRPAIHDESNAWGVGTATQNTISAVRDSARSIWESFPDLRQTLLDRLESFSWKIGIRIALDVLADADVRPLDIVQVRLANRQNFLDFDIRVEYKRLLQVGFSSLSVRDRQLILDWIYERPKHLASGSNKRSSQELAVHRRLHQYQWLAVISDHLEGQWKRRFEHLRADPKLSQLRDPDEIPQVGTWVGPTSPKSSDELITMNIDDIVHFLDEWSPSGSLTDHSRRGLGRELAQMARNRSMYMSRHSSKLKGLHPTYVAEFISGLREAVASGEEVCWTSICDLCEWIIEQPREFESESVAFDDDTHWGQAGKYIVQMLEGGFNSKECTLPFALRARVWPIIKTFLSDPDPSSDHEQSYGPPNMDPITLAINSTRGCAMKTVIEYVLWTYRNMNLDQANDGNLTGLDALPEARCVLEQFLDPDFEPSMSVRAVYGWRFPFLVKVDPQWSMGAVSRIFPVTDTCDGLKQIAWQSYLVSNGLYIPVFRILRRQYRLSLDKLPSPEHGWRHREPDQALGEHILLLYLNGRTCLEEENSLVTLLYQNANPELRQHVNSWVGRGIGEGEVSDAMVERARNLWEWRLEVVASVEEETAAVELKPFVWWLRSGRFDVSWTAEKLYQSLEMAGEVDVDSFALEWLAQHVHEVPYFAVRCLRILSERSYQESWIIKDWVRHVQTILRVAIQCSDVRANLEASELAEILASRRLFAIDDIR